MVCNLKTVLSGSRKSVLLCGVIALAAVALTAGCSGGNRLEAPANAGTAQDLAGTTWTEPESSTTYSFLDDANVDVNKPGLAQPMQGTFAVDSGVVDISIGLKTLAGTWDGKVLVIEDKTLTKN